MSVQLAEIGLAQQHNETTECHLRFQVNWNSYQHLESQGLFNVDPDLHRMMVGNFLPNQDVKITVLLRPDLLSDLEDHATNAATAAAYLQKLSQEQPTDPLLFTESWLGLSVKQQQPQGKTGYRTVWDYLDWSAVTQDDILEEADDLLLKAIINFFKDSAAHRLSADAADGVINEQMLEVSTQLLETLFAVAPSLPSQDENAKQQLVEAITNVFKKSLQANLSTHLQKSISEEPSVGSAGSLPNLFLAETPKIITGKQTKGSTIFETIVSFFQAGKWSVSQLGEQPILHLYFQSENGKWECYAQAREAQKQFVFYSVLPVKAPEEKRRDVAEFIARANYGLIIGNFELDFSDGEIRYKTSIDVEGSQLDIAQIRQLVYANVKVTDKYLPGIMKVIYGDISPAEAITQIED